jgi:hypothetical protein
MSCSKRTLIALAMALAVAASASAQWGGRGGRGGPQAPTPSLQNAVMNSGAEYKMTTKGKDMDVAYAIIGKEDVKGEPGIWLETRMQSAELGGEMVTKMLMVASGSEPGLKRMITQAPGKPPMEMPGMMMGLMKSHQPKESAGKPDMGELVGTESVTVPAGTFNCQHYRKQDKNGQVDYWVATQVASFSWVKMTTPDMTMVLTKILTNETTHIKGEPQKMPGLGGMMPQGQWSDEK